MDVGFAKQVIESRLEEEDRVIATVSEGTLEYMYRYGLAHECRLRSHRGNLGFQALEEHDLFEAMRLATRLSTVEKNICRSSRRNERLRSEIVRRETDCRPSAEGRGWRFALYTGEGAWYGETGGQSNSVAGGD